MKVDFFQLPILMGSVLKLSDDLSQYNKDEQVFAFCFLTSRIMKTSYRKDKTQFIRVFEISDRTGTAKITLFDKAFVSLAKKSMPNPFSILDFDQEKNKDRTKFRPVVLLKLKINVYNGEKSLLFESLAKWYNEDQIKSIINATKQEELDEVKMRKLAKAEDQ